LTNDQTPPYDKMIELMLTVNKKGKTTRMTTEEVRDIRWNTIMLEKGFKSSKKTIAIRESLLKFEFLPDEKIEDLDIIK